MSFSLHLDLKGSKKQILGRINKLKAMLLLVIGVKKALGAWEALDGVGCPKTVDKP